MKARPKGAVLVVHAPAGGGEPGKLVKGERFLFGETICGECESRLADFMDEVTCLKCLKELGRDSPPPSPQIIIMKRREEDDRSEEI